MANFALNYSFSRNLDLPLDEDAVKNSLVDVKNYVHTKSKCYAGQLFSVTGDTENVNGLYIALSVGEEGSVIKLASQDALDAVSAAAGKIDKIQLNGNELTINDKTVNIDLSDYSTVAYVDSAITSTIEKMLWLPVEGDVEKHIVRHWKGTRDKYEFLVKNNAVDEWTKYVVIDEVSGESILTEYYGTNQVSELTGQMLPAKSVIGNISEISPLPYDRYLVGNDASGYKVYEYVISSENSHRWIIKNFDYRHGIRIIDRGLKNYIYVDGKLKTYDDVDCGLF
jgi:hypothetical protein